MGYFAPFYPLKTIKLPLFQNSLLYEFFVKFRLLSKLYIVSMTYNMSYTCITK